MKLSVTLVVGAEVTRLKLKSETPCVVSCKTIL